MCVTWVASPSALKHPINSAPSIALQQHVKHGQQNRSGRTISQPNGFRCRSTAALPSPGNVSLGLAEACSRQCLYPVLTCRGLLKPLGLSCVLCIPALKQMSSSHFDTSLSLLQCIGYICPRRGHKLGNDIWQTGASTSLTRLVPLTTLVGTPLRSLTCCTHKYAFFRGMPSIVSAYYAQDMIQYTHKETAPHLLRTSSVELHFTRPIECCRLLRFLHCCWRATRE